MIIFGTGFFIVDNKKYKIKFSTNKRDDYPDEWTYNPTVIAKGILYLASFRNITIIDSSIETKDEYIISKFNDYITTERYMKRIGIPSTDKNRFPFYVVEFDDEEIQFQNCRLLLCQDFMIMAADVPDNILNDI